MAIVTIEDLLDRARRFEERLTQYYASIRDECQDNGVRLLTYYLARHRKHLDEGLAGFEAKQIARIGKIQLKYDVDFDPARALALMETAPCDVTGQQLLDAAVEYDAMLIDLYKSILKQPLTAEAFSLMESLIRVEERDIVMLKKTMATHLF
jgi:hypothetical protein